MCRESGLRAVTALRPGGGESASLLAFPFSFTSESGFSLQRETDRRVTERKGSGVGVPVQMKTLVSCWMALDQVWEPADHKLCLVTQVTQGLSLLVEEAVFGLRSTGLL